MTQLTREHPHLKAICKDGSCWVLPLESRDDFLSHWMAGKTFWSGLSAYGDTVWVKLADITGVAEKTEVSLAADAEEEAELKRRAMVDG